MKILYTTDLHGLKWKYDRIIDLSTSYDMVIIGADILPKNINNIHKQQFNFLTKYLPRFFNSINKPIIIDFGNDDHKAFYSDFLQLINEHSKHDNVYYSHLNSVNINGYTFIGMHYVPDYPFRLKDWCRRDNTRLMDTQQFGIPILSTKDGYENIHDYYTYLTTHNNLFEYLMSLIMDSSITDNKTVLLTHAPPVNLGLDVCIDKREVGSADVYNFISKRNFRLSLHGHIHESPFVSGIWKNKINNTVCIQPGQEGINKLTYCSIDLSDNSSNRYIIKG